jgi:hypothetical protein
MTTVFSRLVPLALLLAACLAAPAAAQPMAPPIPELSAEQWREDLRFMVGEIERRHPAPYAHAGREAFAAAVAELDRRIPGLQRNQIIAGMMRIAAMVGDGHTRVDPRKDTRFGFPSLPLKLYLFEDGLYVRAATPAFAGLVGARIEAIGGVPVAEAIRRAATLASADNAIGPRLYIPLYLAMPDILQALDLSPRRDAATLMLVRGGRRWTVTVPAGQVDPVWPPDTDISLVTPNGWVDARQGAQPLWLQAPLDLHRLIELPDRSAIYVQLNMVADINGQGLTAFGERIRTRAEALNPRAIVLDLRLNQGGNGNLRSGLVRALIRTEDSDTRLFVLTGRGTFSASQFILDDLDRLTDAIFVGEPAGSKPSHFGDAYRNAMPNSGISMRTSILWWQAGQNRDPWTWVDVAAPLTFADYEAGRDPVLEAALSYQSGPSLREQLIAAAASGGAPAVRQAIAAIRADPVHRYANQMRQFVQGAELISAGGRQEAALAAAESAAQLFPDSIDAALVHAIVADRAGQADVARAEGARVLRLDPNNRFVRPLLERLGRATDAGRSGGAVRRNR